MCRNSKVPELELLLFVRTRWSSLYACLDRALTLQEVPIFTQLAETENKLLICAQAVSCFTALADESEHVPKLRKKKYIDFRLSKLEWEQLKLLHEVMGVSNCIRTLYRVQMLTTNDRSWRLLNNRSRIRMSQLSGARSLSWSSCNRDGKALQILRHSMSSQTRFMVDWRTYASGIIKLTTQMYISFVLVSTVTGVTNNESNVYF